MLGGKVKASPCSRVTCSPTTVICSQGKVIPYVLAGLKGEDDPTPYKTPKGSGWVLTWAGDRLLGLSRI